MNQATQIDQNVRLTVFPALLGEHGHTWFNRKLLSSLTSSTDHLCGDFPLQRVPYPACRLKL